MLVAMLSGNVNGLLLATDIAARGLDIAGVQHVIHYQVPRTTEVHNCFVYSHCLTADICRSMQLHMMCSILLFFWFFVFFLFLFLFVLQHECWIAQYLPRRTVHITQIII